MSPPCSAGGRWAIGCLIAGLVLSACTGSSESSGRTVPSPGASLGGTDVRSTGGSAVFGVLGEPPTLDPYGRRATDLTYTLVRPLYPSLYRWNPDGTPVAYLAESLEVTRGGMRVRLAQFRWSDGTPVTARDVVASIRRARPPSGFARIRRARATDSRTLTLRGPALGDSVDDWERALATGGFVLPAGRAARPGGRFGGPFVLAGHRPGLQVVYEPNPGWAGEGPQLEQLKVQFVSGVGFLLDLLERGDLDGAAIPSSVNLGDRLAARGLDHAEALGWESVYLDFRSSGLDRRARRAFAAAVDLDSLAEGIVREDGRVSHSLNPAPGPAGDDGPFRIAGGGSVSSIALLLTGPGGDELISLTQRIIQRQLDDAGASVEIASAEPAAVYGGGHGDPGGVKVLRSAGIPGASDSPRAARVLDTFPLFHVETVVAFRAGLNGIEVNPTIDGALWNAEQWWLGAP